MRLKNKTELTTGGNSGIGLATAGTLHQLSKKIGRLTFWPREHPGRQKEVKCYVPPVALCRVLDRRQSHLCARSDLASLPRETGYSKSHFLRAFHASTGKTSHPYIIQLRLEAARRLLRSKSLTLFEIALTCGFANDAHFSRVFRQNFGVSPRQYRMGA